MSAPLDAGGIFWESVERDWWNVNKISKVWFFSINKVFIKLVVNKQTDKVLGLHYIGNGSAEIIQGFSVAIVNGLKKNQFDKTIGIHPTSAEEIVTLK